MGNKITGIYVGTHKVRPSWGGWTITTLTYDFTTSADWWTTSDWCLRDSNWWYRSGNWSDWSITAPSEIFDWEPNKIKIYYNKVNASSWTWIWSTDSWGTWGILNPAQYHILNQMNFERNGSVQWQWNIWANPTWNVVWEMTIDRSVTPRAVTHNINGYTHTETMGYLNNFWSAEDLKLRIVNRQDWTWSIYITWAEFIIETY